MFIEKSKLAILLIIVFQLKICILGDVVDSAKIIFYFGPTYEDHQSYGLDDVASILEHPKFVHKKTSCYLHGYTNTQDDFSVHLLVDSYLKGNEYNFLSVDYAAMVNGSYISAQRNVLKLVPRISNSILNLVDAGLDFDSISLVGHSLGGVAIGLIGRDIYQKTNGSFLIPRISPLDPSNPDAHEDFILPKIEKTDAKFIDVIHSSAGQRGTSIHIGHADFWPNGGKPIQPGCPEESVNKLCSHSKAYAYWAQSVAKSNSEQLLSYRANNFKEFSENEDKFKERNGIPMGINCPTSASGDYYLRLNSSYGENGNPLGLPK